MGVAVVLVEIILVFVLLSWLLLLRRPSSLVFLLLLLVPFFYAIGTTAPQQSHLSCQPRPSGLPAFAALVSLPACLPSSLFRRPPHPAPLLLLFTRLLLRRRARLQLIKMKVDNKRHASVVEQSNNNRKALQVVLQGHALTSRHLNYLVPSGEERRKQLLTERSLLIVVYVPKTISDVS